MAIVSLETLKSYFQAGLQPTRQQYEDLIDTLASIGITGGAEINTWTYVAELAANTPPPNTGTIRWNTTDPLTANALYVSKSTTFSEDIKSLLDKQLVSDNYVVVSSVETISQRVVYKIDSVADSGAYYSVAVTEPEQSGASFTENQLISFSTIVTATGGGGGSDWDTVSTLQEFIDALQHPTKKYYTIIQPITVTFGVTDVLITADKKFVGYPFFVEAGAGVEFNITKNIGGDRIVEFENEAIHCTHPDVRFRSKNLNPIGEMIVKIRHMISSSDQNFQVDLAQPAEMYYEKSTGFYQADENVVQNWWDNTNVKREAYVTSVEEMQEACLNSSIEIIVIHGIGLDFNTGAQLKLGSSKYITGGKLELSASLINESQNDIAVHFDHVTCLGTIQAVASPNQTFVSFGLFEVYNVNPIGSFTGNWYLDIQDMIGFCNTEVANVTYNGTIKDVYVTGENNTTVASGRCVYVSGSGTEKDFELKPVDAVNTTDLRDLDMYVVKVQQSTVGAQNTISGIKNGETRYVNLQGVADGATIYLDPTSTVGEYTTTKPTTGVYVKLGTKIGGGSTILDGVMNVDLQVVDTGLVNYDGATDTYELAPTLDGQVLNLGQEGFFNAYNTTATPVTALNPKVMLSTGAKAGEEDFQNVLLPIAGDMINGAVYGINTTDIANGQYGKCAVYGYVNDVDTTAWSLNQILYVDPTTAGDLTNVIPPIDAYAVAKVLKVDATTGILYVNTLCGSSFDTNTIEFGTVKLHLTGDEDVITAGTFYMMKFEDEGIVTTATENAVVADNTTVALGQDHISEIFTEESIVTGGLREGQIEFTINQTGGEEKVYAELYLADVDGNAITSGLAIPNGDLGVPPILTYSTSLLNSESGTTIKSELRGNLDNDYTVPANSRVRLHILCEKVGTIGTDKTFTVYFGSDHDSYLTALSEITIDDVEGLPKALDERVKWFYPYAATTVENRTMTRIGDWTTISNKSTSAYPAPVKNNTPAWAFDPTPNWVTQTVLGDVATGLDFTTTDNMLEVDGWRVWLTGQADVEFTLQLWNIDNPNNPVLWASEYISEGQPSGWYSILDDVDTLTLYEGHRFRMALIAHAVTNDTTYHGLWRGFTGIGVPASGQMYHAVGTITISKTDDLSADRSAQLGQLTQGDFINVSEQAAIGRFINYRVIGAILDQGTYYEIPVAINTIGDTVRDNRLLAIAWDIIGAASDTDYVEDTGDMPSYFPDGNVKGFVTQNIDDIGSPALVLDDNVYGTDLYLDFWVLDEDWDIVAFNGTQGSGGGGGGGGAETFTELTDTPVNYVGAASQVAAVKTNEQGIEFVPLTDANAIHDNVANEIDSITEKLGPVSTDLILIEDTEDSNNKKKIQIANLPSSGSVSRNHCYMESNYIFSSAGYAPFTRTGIRTDNPTNSWAGNIFFTGPNKGFQIYTDATFMGIQLQAGQPTGWYDVVFNFYYQGVTAEVSWFSDIFIEKRANIGAVLTYHGNGTFSVFNDPSDVFRAEVTVRARVQLAELDRVAIALENVTGNARQLTVNFVTAHVAEVIDP